MVSRPIVAAPLVGWSVGDPSVGLATGVLFEMLWLRQEPVGGHIAPDSTLAAVATAAVSAGVRAQTGLGVYTAVFMSFLVLLPVSILGVKMDVALRRGLGRIARSAQDVQARGADKQVYLYFLLALVLGFLLAFVILMPIVLAGTSLLKWVAIGLPPLVTKALSYGYWVAPVVGAVDLILKLDETGYAVLFFIGFVAALAGCIILV